MQNTDGKNSTVKEKDRKQSYKPEADDKNRQDDNKTQKSKSNMQSRSKTNDKEKEDMYEDDDE